MSVKHNLEQWISEIDSDGMCDISDGQVIYLIRSYSTLEAKCAALAAENAAIHETIEAVRSVADNSSGIAGWHLNGDIATWEEILPEINDIKTPATDAFLAEVRAQGVEIFVSHMDHPHSPYEFTHGYMDKHAIEFAAKLRQGAAL